MEPIGSPMPNGTRGKRGQQQLAGLRADKVVRERPAPSALPRREAYRKSVQRSRCKWSPLVRIVRQVAVFELCRKCRADAMQYVHREVPPVHRCRHVVQERIAVRQIEIRVGFVRQPVLLEGGHSEFDGYVATVSQKAGSVTRRSPTSLYKGTVRAAQGRSIAHG